jgi:lipopolysaccharide export LptBFGC system permease protein LptF
MPFFLFSQNNSGGSFVINDKVAEYVVIEASKAKYANADAQEIGIYFNGVSTGDDCGCCGDRWGRVDSSDATDQPGKYGKLIDLNSAKSTIIYYTDGTVWRSEDVKKRMKDLDEERQARELKNKKVAKEMRLKTMKELINEFPEEARSYIEGRK